MKTIAITIFLVLLIPLKAQSVLTLDAGTSLGVLTTADLCAGIINGGGILYGDGTICGGLVSTGEVTNEMPLSFEVFSNYPNPFNPVTTVKYQIPASGYVTVKLYDQLGREALKLFEGEQNTGYYSTVINAGGLASGIYFLKISYNGVFKILKISLIK